MSINYKKKIDLVVQYIAEKTINALSQYHYMVKIKKWVNTHSGGKIGIVIRTREQLLNDYLHVINIDDKEFPGDTDIHMVTLQKYQEQHRKDFNKIICMYRKDFPQWLFMSWNSIYCFSDKDEDGIRELAHQYYLEKPKGWTDVYTYGDQLIDEIKYMLNTFHPENMSRK